MGMIEAEIRSFITEEKYEELIGYFIKNGRLIGEDFQETFYFDSVQDIRIQRNLNFSKIWMKRGKMHDEAREEIEVRFPREDFEKLEKIFLSMGMNVRIKWFRKRHEFEWSGIRVCIDHTRGYGHIIELEKIVDESGREKALSELRENMEKLGIALTPRKEFEERFEDYEHNWKKLVNS